MPFLAAAPLVAGVAGTAATVAPLALPALATGVGTTIGAIAAPAAVAAGTGISLGTALTVGSLLLEGTSALSESRNMRALGESQQAMADYEAKQADINAGQTRASSQRAAAEQRRRGQIAASNATAAAAAGGGSISDPTIQSIIGQIDNESNYRSDVALYEGEDAARGLETQASLKRYEGAASRTAANTKANTAVLSGGAAMGKTLMDNPAFVNKAQTLLDKYG